MFIVYEKNNSMHLLPQQSRSPMIDCNKYNNNIPILYITVTLDFEKQNNSNTHNSESKYK